MTCYRRNRLKPLIVSLSQFHIQIFHTRPQFRLENMKLFGSLRITHIRDAYILRWCSWWVIGSQSYLPWNSINICVLRSKSKDQSPCKACFNISMGRWGWFQHYLCCDTNPEGNFSPSLLIICQFQQTHWSSCNFSHL